MGKRYIFFPSHMKVIRIIAQILILYGFYYVGVFIVKFTHLPLPPSILGLLLLFICLQRNWIKVDYIKEGAAFLIGFMTLFFIPPMVGIIKYPELFSVDGTLLMVSVIVSTLFAILLTSIICQWIEKKELATKKIENEVKTEQEEGLEHARESVHR